MNLPPCIIATIPDPLPDLFSVKIRLQRLPFDRVRAGPIDFDLLSSPLTMQQVTAFLSHRLALQLSIPASRIDLVTIESPSSPLGKQLYLLAHLRENRILTQHQAMSHYTNRHPPSPTPLPDFLDI